MHLDIEDVEWCLVVVYMPHGGYKEIEIEQLYEQLSDIANKARASREIILIGGTSMRKLRRLWTWGARIQSVIMRISLAMTEARG